MNIGLVTGAFFNALGIVLGAFGAHALKKSLSPEMLESFETGVKYLIYQGMGLLLLGLLQKNSPIPQASIWLLIIGTVLFSGSIFLLSTKSLIGLENYKWLGPITPIGGTLMLISWLWTGIVLAKDKI